MNKKNTCSISSKWFWVILIYCLISNIITKANEKAFVRRRVLNEFGFGLIDDPKIVQYDDYFIKQF